MASHENVVYDHEVQLENIFQRLSDGFKRLDKLPEAKQQGLLKELTTQMQEAKTLIREFEREARIDGMPPNELNFRKKQMVQELNGFIGLKKAYSSQAGQRGELLGGASTSQGLSQSLASTSTMELMTMGRKDIATTDQSLLRTERIMNDTIAIGAQTAETLQQQGKQLEKVLDDLDEIHFTMKKARQVIRDMARGLATDRCIMTLLLLVVIAIVVLVVLKILKIPKKDSIKLPGPTRRMLWDSGFEDLLW